MQDLVLATAWTRGDRLGLIGLLLTAGGFGVGIWQLVRAANAAVAIKQTVIAANRAQLLFLLPQFRVLETELDWAISLKPEGRDLAARVLTSYVHLAHEVAGLITVHHLGDSAVGDELRASAKLASAAKNKIYSTKSSITSLTSDFRTSLATIGESLSNLGVAEQSNTAGN